jgi:hypothetical protein
MHCYLWLSVALPCSFFVFSPLHHSLFISQKYKQNYRALKIQNLSESKKEQTKGTKQFF